MRARVASSALTRAMAAVRGLIAPAMDPRVAAERARVLQARARLSCGLAIGVIPFTIVTYNAAFFPGQLLRGAGLAAAADALLVLLWLGVRRGAFQRTAWLPFILLVQVCNATEAGNLVLTGGVASGFVFPYHVVSFGIAILYPGPLLAAVLLTVSLPLGYLTMAAATGASLGNDLFVSNLMLLIDIACVASIGNHMMTNLFLREVRARLDLEAANSRLRELDRLKSEFFANVSHELRTPLTLILAPAASLAEGDLDASQLSMVETIRRNASRLLQLINDLLLLATLDAGGPQVTQIAVNVAAVVRRIVDEARAHARSLELALEAEIEPGEPIWNGDERHLERIVLNLVSNACKFSRPGGRVRVSVTQVEGGIRIAVIDQGIGIAAADLEKIFDRFVQVESSASRRFEGTGIGLSIVRQLATLHGGSVAVQSEPGRGSTFEVFLPRRTTLGAARAPVPAPAEAAGFRLQPAVAAPVGPPSGTGPRLMVVEDNTELLGFLVQELGRWYRVLPHADSAEALRAAREGPPDLILSDIMMPGLDGIALARELRADPRTRDVPVVLLSAREEVESKLLGFAAGADDYVQKPFEAQELRARIELHLRLRAQARDLRAALERLKQAESSLVQSEKMVALGRMIAGVAHEMNNPLHFLRGNLSLLRRRLPEGTHAPLFADIEESLERMTSVTRQLLLFGRKHDGAEAAPVRLAEVVPLAVRMVAPQTPGGVRISHQVDGEEVQANPQDVFQIVLNLLHNAIQAVDPRDGQVSIVANRAGDRVELLVADNGCGIAPENLPRVFDPFFTTKPPGSGTGLGLSIVQELVASQRGSVRVDSERGRGTTVAVTLPAARS